MKMVKKGILCMMVLAILCTAFSAFAESKPVELSFMSQGGKSNEKYIEILNEYIEEFNATNDFNVVVKSEFYENEQYKTKIATLMASNSQPDIFFTWEAGFMKPFVEGGKIYPIGEALDKDAEWKDRFVDGFFPLVTFDEKVYAVPNIINYCVMFYNKQIFEANNVEVPTTYEELLAVCETLVANGVVPIAFGTKDAWLSGQYLQALSNGVGGMDLYGDIVSGAVRWDDPRYVEAGGNVQKLLDLNAFAPGYLGRSNDETIEAFNAGEAAMFYSMASNLARMSDPANPVAEHLDFFLFPTPGNAQSPEVVVGSISQVYAISAKSKNIDASVAFLKGLSDKAIQERVCYEWSNMPATNIDIDASKLNPVFAKLVQQKDSLAGLTPWFDRVFGAGLGVEFNNASLAIMSGEDVQGQLEALEQFAIDNAAR